MNPSIELREEAAKLHEEMTKAEDELHEAQDAGEAVSDQAAFLAWAGYEEFCEHHGFRLLTDCSRLYLRCAETNIPLCDLDECIETETGQLMIVKQAA